MQAGVDPGGIGDPWAAAGAARRAEGVRARVDREVGWGGRGVSSGWGAGGVVVAVTMLGGKDGRENQADL